MYSRLIGEVLIPQNTTRHIEDIASKASASEALVADMTKDIKSLDTAKRQITWSMTSLKRLQMLGNVCKGVYFSDKVSYSC